MELSFLAVWNRIWSFLWSLKGGKHRVLTTPKTLDCLSRGNPDLPTTWMSDAPLPAPSDPVTDQVVPRPYREHGEFYLRSRVHVAEAVINTLGDKPDEIGRELMEVSGGLLKYPPLAGLERAARTLVHIWAALPMVDSDRISFLFLVDRCAIILMSIRENVALAGDDVVRADRRLRLVFRSLSRAFEEVEALFDKQSGRGFFKRYLQREEIRERHYDCNQRLTDVVDEFSRWAQNRLTQALLAMSQRLQDDHDALRDYVISSRAISRGPYAHAQLEPESRSVVPPHVRAPDASQPSRGPLAPASGPTDSGVHDDRQLVLPLRARAASGLPTEASATDEPPGYEIVESGGVEQSTSIT